MLARCPEGHESATVYDMRRYRVLLESATLALHDGYANESVSTFAAALERAHEFFVRVVLRARLVSSAQVDKVWKDVDSQSERQLGAFYFLWLVETGEHYPLDQRYPTIRNRIIHKGRLATVAEAREFGVLVFDRLKKIEEALRTHQSAVAEEQAHEVSAQQASVPAGLDSVVLTPQTVRVDNKTNDVTSVETLDELLASIPKARARGFLP